MSATKTSVAAQSALCRECPEYWQGDRAHSYGDAHCRATGHEVDLLTRRVLSLDSRTRQERKDEGRRVPTR